MSDALYVRGMPTSWFICVCEYIHIIYATCCCCCRRWICVTGILKFKLWLVLLLLIACNPRQVAYIRIFYLYRRCNYYIHTDTYLCTDLHATSYSLLLRVSTYSFTTVIINNISSILFPPLLSLQLADTHCCRCGRLFCCHLQFVLLECVSLPLHWYASVGTFTSALLLLTLYYLSYGIFTQFWSLEVISLHVRCCYH